GWGIGQRIQQISKGILEVNQGSLYPALQRLEKAGLIVSEWGATESNRRARYYRLTAAGRRALGEELESWKRFAAGLDAVLRSTCTSLSGLELLYEPILRSAAHTPR